MAKDKMFPHSFVTVCIHADGYAHDMVWANVCTTNFDRYLSILLKATGAMNKLPDKIIIFYVSYLIYTWPVQHTAPP